MKYKKTRGIYTLRECKPPQSRGPYEPSEANFSRLGRREGRGGFPRRKFREKTLPAPDFTAQPHLLAE
ncbi:Hypothetical protein FKW44_022068 [Caligus rogercresseyi]|uniref:Uncharacterized protein n=1 Tax=Caligus rogercresseyi TaxID=217165 RepID=A0A7T8JWL9_CALRO|nr:Hypothetical protein FKW44_022068 [Caligus rogercresseyi]